ncbi:MAG: hypothetical protein WC993_09240 [Methanoculleus sp.]
MVVSVTGAGGYGSEVAAPVFSHPRRLDSDLRRRNHRLRARLDCAMSVR